MILATPGCIHTAYAGASVQLPWWRIRENVQGEEMPIWTAGVLTALTFTIFRLETEEPIGTSNRNGLNVGGITFTDTDHVSHIIAAADNALADPAQDELRGVDYVITAPSGVIRRLVLYHLKPPEV